MGAIFTREYVERQTGVQINDEPPLIAMIEVHRSTGKWPFEGGKDHLPEWGDWYHDGPAMIRNCKFNDGVVDYDNVCDVIDVQPTKITVEPDGTVPTWEGVLVAEGLNTGDGRFMDYFDDETGEVVRMTVQMWATAGLCWDWMTLDDWNCIGGVLHSVFQNGNCRDSDIEYAIENAGPLPPWGDRQESPWSHAKTLMFNVVTRALLDLDETQRDAVFAAIHQFWQLDPKANRRPEPPAGYFVPLVDGETRVGIAGHPDVVNDTPVEEGASSEWAHTAVVASYPSGTDPLAAIRDAMTVFMEKKDGSNALEWWQQVRWWHGGPAGFKRGDRLLPPSETGVLPGLDFTDREAVYITSSRDAAIMFAARHDRPALYEVTGMRTAPAPDDVIPNDQTSARVPSITVHRIEQISGLELRRVLYELETTRLEAMNPEEAGE